MEQYVMYTRNKTVVLSTNAIKILNIVVDFWKIKSEFLWE